MEQLFSNPYGEISLKRYPEPKNQTLQAWDAADRYTLDYFSENFAVEKPGPILTINDSFGALSLPLAKQGYSVTSYGDSFLSHIALQKNCSANAVTAPLLESKESNQALTQKYRAVFLKVPKSAALLEDQLYKIRPWIDAKTTIIGSGKTKHIHTSTLKLFEKIIGTTTTSLAKSKARLIFPQYDDEIVPGANPWPKTWPFAGETVINHANVFSARRLDRGTQLMLDYLQNQKIEPAPKNIVDLGCGNGILSLILARKYPEATVVGTDQSYMAIQSSQENAAAWSLDDRASFKRANGFSNAQGDLLNLAGSTDLVVCNPPFHDNYVLGDQTASTMFREAHAILRENGKLIVVANRHLPYRHQLSRLFNTTTVATSNKKFIILTATK